MGVGRGTGRGTQEKGEEPGFECWRAGQSHVEEGRALAQNCRFRLAYQMHWQHWAEQAGLHQPRAAVGVLLGAEVGVATWGPSWGAGTSLEEE